MAIRVEFYGTARQRTAVESWDDLLPVDTTTLGELWSRLIGQFPRLQIDSAHADALSPYFAYHVEGVGFVNDASFRLNAGQTLVVLSADAGG